MIRQGWRDPNYATIFHTLLVCHEDREVRLVENMARHAAKDELPDSAEVGRD